ncbi:MAG: hypothetical protein ACI841_000216 [Planctomycetota bacterium]|jgi:hypothetical protein
MGRWLAAGVEDMPPFPPFGHFQEGQRGEVEAALERERSGLGLTMINRFDSDLGWSNFSGEQPKEQISINSIGARSLREYTAETEPGTTRIICYGSSFVFGSEVTTQEAWPSQIEAMATDFEAVNMGVGSYGTDQASLLFRRHGLLGASIAVIGFNVENVARNVNRYRAVYVPGDLNIYSKPRFLLDERDELQLLALPYSTRTEALEAVLEDSIVERLRPYEYWTEEAPLRWSTASKIRSAIRAHRRRSRRFKLLLEPEKEPYRVTLAILQAFDSEAQAAGAEQTLVVLFGMRSDLAWQKSHGFKFWQGMIEDLRRTGIQTLDASDVIIGMGKPAPFLNTHYNANANGAVARAVLDQLRSSSESSISR